uniref:Uncharacterized protein n=1 Tax=Amphimedon queenslandica TaxID=400682 RepID=A0A1X7STT0_AMPQE
MSSGDGTAVLLEGISSNKHRGIETDGLVCCLSIPNSLLQRWYEAVLLRKQCGDVVVTMTSQLNEHIPGNVIRLKEHKDPAQSRSKSLEQQLRIKGCHLIASLKRSSRQKKQKTLNGRFIIDIKQNDIITVDETTVAFHESFEEYKLKFEEEKGRLSEIWKVMSFQNTGKDIDGVQDRQRRRKISALKESCSVALHFADSFNIDLLSVVFRTRTNNDIITLNYTRDNTEELQSVENKDITVLQQILFLLDRFAVSDEFYHELTMLFPSLPRSYL